MKNVTAALCLGVLVAAAPVVVFADDSRPEILNSSAGAVSGANRLGGPTITSPPHAWTPTGQDAQQLSITDIKKEHPRNQHIVGPPVPRNAVLPAPEPPKPEAPPIQSTDSDK